jgi:hypothetical protein
VEHLESGIENQEEADGGVIKYRADINLLGRDCVRRRRDLGKIIELEQDALILV